MENTLNDDNDGGDGVDGICPSSVNENVRCISVLLGVEIHYHRQKQLRTMTGVPCDCSAE